MFNGDKRRRGPARLEASRTKPVGSTPSDTPFFTWQAAATVAIATAILVALIVHGGDRPFPYRLGQRVDRDLRLKVKLALKNETKTRQQREDQANQAPMAYRLDPQPIRALRVRLGELVRAVAARCGAAIRHFGPNGPDQRTGEIRSAENLCRRPRQRGVATRLDRTIADSPKARARPAADGG